MADIVFDQSGDNYTIHLSRAAVLELSSYRTDPDHSEFFSWLDTAVAKKNVPPKALDSIKFELKGYIGYQIIEMSNNDASWGRIKVQGTLPTGQISTYSTDDTYSGSG